MKVQYRIVDMQGDPFDTSKVPQTFRGPLEITKVETWPNGDMLITLMLRHDLPPVG